MLSEDFRSRFRASLNVSEACLTELLDLIEGELLDFQKKRKEKVLDKNAQKMADIFNSGKLRVTKTGTLIGDPQALQGIKDIEKENREVGLGRKVGL